MAANKGMDMAELEVGQKAPQFQLPRDGGSVVKLSDFEGKPVVLYFYPQDDTETCTAEAIDFSRLKPEFARLGAPVIGVSPDSTARHDKFKKKHKLTVDLASDEEQKTLNAYGVWGEKTLFGRNYMGVIRTTFLIGRDGRIARIWRNVRVRGHALEVLEAARALP
jgi:thioredoxin-dependent peroxiredoxin